MFKPIIHNTENKDIQHYNKLIASKPKKGTRRITTGMKGYKKMVYPDEIDAYKTGKLQPTTDENLRKAIEILDEVSFPHPDQQWAIEQLICAAHALGILKLRHARLREGAGTCRPENVKSGFTTTDKYKLTRPTKNSLFIEDDAGSVVVAFPDYAVDREKYASFILTALRNAKES